MASHGPDYGLGVCEFPESGLERDIAASAAEVLGTTTLRDTIDASLPEIVNARRRLELVALLSEPGCYDLDAVDNAWGGDE